MNNEPYLHGVDDIDVAFARLERVPPPPGLHGAVMQAIGARARQRRRLGYVLIGTALFAAIVASFLLGQQLRISGAIDLAGLALANVDLFLDAPLEFALAVAEGVPWLLVLPVVVCFGTILWATRLALTPGVRLRSTGR